ncbi:MULTISPECIES: HNH endonuclease [unclassified Mycolicibacterium]|uniref:HNH endonuclease n=1 Tax=unclassified Mycolicibacterium TaxID=2636767 RepID=UPI0035CC2CE9
MPLPRPCLGCGELTQNSRCNNCKPKKVNKPSIRDTARWKRLSTRIRKDSPFCEQCSTTTDLTVDHIISLAEDPALAYEPLNLRVLCRYHNGLRQDQCTDAERAAVHAAIALHKARLARVPTPHTHTQHTPKGLR